VDARIPRVMKKSPAWVAAERVSRRIAKVRHKLPSTATPEETRAFFALAAEGKIK